MPQHRSFSKQLRYERERRSWSQKTLADKIGTTEKTISRWEQGKNIPQHGQREQLLELFGKTTEELGLLGEINNNEQKSSTLEYQDWGDAPQPKNLQGRNRESQLLKRWIQTQNSQVVAILGLGGIGKTSLCRKVADNLKDSFQFVFWRSLQNAPSIDQILLQCIRLFSQGEYIHLPDHCDDKQDFDEHLRLLIRCLQKKRCLLILDNVETIMKENCWNGQYRDSYEGYGQLIQRIGETRHQSCLLLTSREKPREIAFLEETTSSVKTLHLEGITLQDGQKLLKKKELIGSQDQWQKLINIYRGHPFSLILVANTIQNLFNNNIPLFLQSGEFSFGYLEDLIEQQFNRLTHYEVCILYWLAIEREPVSVSVLCDDMIPSISKSNVITAMESLRHRHLVEKRPHSLYTLQPVIMDYTTNHLIETICNTFTSNNHDIWKHFVFLKAQSKDFIRASQKSLILHSIADKLLEQYGRENTIQRLKEMLSVQRHEAPNQRNYLANNILRLLVWLQSDLQAIDFSSILFRQTHFHDLSLKHTNFTNAQFSACTFRHTFGNILSIAYSPLNDTFAIGTATGEIWIYDAFDYTPHAQYKGHTDGVWSLAFHSKGNFLASSSDDQTIHLWNIETGKCIQIFHGHTNRVRSIVFHPYKQWLASCSDDQTIKLWDIEKMTCIATLYGHTDRIWSIAFSPDGTLLATGSNDTTIRLWDVQTKVCLKQFIGHHNWIRSIAFAPDGKTLVSCSDDYTIRIWNVLSGNCTKVLEGHHNRIWSIAFHPQKHLLISGSEDNCIRVWDIHEGICLNTLQAHTQGIRSVAINQEGTRFITGGDDQTIRVWELPFCECLKVLRGYTHRIWSVAFHPNDPIFLSSSEDRQVRRWEMQAKKSPPYKEVPQVHTHGARALAFDPGGTYYVSAGEDQTVRLWDTQTNNCQVTFYGHTNWVRCIAFSLDGQLIASGSEDCTVRIWNVQDKKCLAILKGHTSWVRSVTFSPDGQFVASGGDDHNILLWNIKSAACVKTYKGHTGRIRSIAFNPSGTMLASGGEDQKIYLWNVLEGDCIDQMYEDAYWVRSLCFDPSGNYLASSGDDSAISIWNMSTLTCVKRLYGHTGRIRSISIHPYKPLLLSGSDDGTIRLWNIKTFECERVFTIERPYEGMNITNTYGLTDAQKESLLTLGAVEE